MKRTLINGSVMIALASALVASHSMATTLPDDAQGYYEVRVPFQGLKSTTQAPSTFTGWEVVGLPYNVSMWVEDLTSIIGQAQSHLGTVWPGDVSDQPFNDFKQSRQYTVDEMQYEQRRRETEEGDIVRDGVAIRHDRTMVRTEYRDIDVTSTAWSSLNSTDVPVCGAWEKTPNANSPYITPWTQSASERRECVIQQKRTLTLDVPYDSIREVNDSVSIEQRRELHYWDVNNVSGYLNNRSCKTMLDSYNANKSKINKAHPGWSPNGWKRLDLTGSLNYTTYCNGGWTMVVAQRDNIPHAWTGSNYQGRNYAAVYGQGFTLPNSYIPAHSAIGLGRDGSVIYPFTNGNYHTGDMHQSVRHTNGNTYYIHRYKSSHYRSHNRHNWSTNVGEYNNTLAMDINTRSYNSGQSGGNGSWAFSPYASARCERGWANGGNRYTSNEGWAYTVFVK